MIPVAVARLIVLFSGYLYPAYKSHKAIAKKDTREYVKWMMYWVVFAFFTVSEIFLDLLFSFWFPFYDELKLLFLLWLASPSFRGATFIYRRALHPTLSRKSQEIDQMIEEVQRKGYGIIVSWSYQAMQVCSEACLSMVSHVYMVILPRMAARRGGLTQDHVGFPSGPPVQPPQPPMMPVFDPRDPRQQNLYIDFYSQSTSHYATLPRGLRVRARPRPKLPADPGQGFDEPDVDLGFPPYHRSPTDPYLMYRRNSSGPQSPPMRGASEFDRFGLPPLLSLESGRSGASIEESSTTHSERENSDEEEDFIAAMTPERHPTATAVIPARRRGGEGKGLQKKSESMSSLIPNRHEKAMKRAAPVRRKIQRKRGASLEEEEDGASASEQPSTSPMKTRSKKYEKK